MVKSLGMNFKASGHLFTVSMTKQGEPEVEINSDGIVTKMMG